MEEKWTRRKSFVILFFFLFFFFKEKFLFRIILPQTTVSPAL